MMKKIVLALVVVLALVGSIFAAQYAQSVTISANVDTFYVATPTSKVHLNSVSIDSLANTVNPSTCNLKDGTTVIRILNLTNLALPAVINTFGVYVQNPKIDFGTNSGTATAVTQDK
jgi:hypothetical protein